MTLNTNYEKIHGFNKIKVICKAWKIAYKLAMKKGARVSAMKPYMILSMMQSFFQYRCYENMLIWRFNASFLLKTFGFSSFFNTNFMIINYFLNRGLCSVCSCLRTNDSSSSQQI